MPNAITRPLTILAIATLAAAPALGQCKPQWIARPLAEQSALDGSVSGFALFQGKLVFTGTFSTPGQGVASRSVATWDGQSWESLGGGVGSPDFPPSTVRSPVVYHDELIVATRGGYPPDPSLQGVSRWTGSQWLPLGGGLNGTVNDLLVVGENLVAGGNFTRANGVITTRDIALWNGTTWSTLGPASGFNHPVNELALFRGEIIAGGSFEIAGGETCYGVARLEDGAWRPLGPGLTNGVSGGSVFDMVVFDDSLIVAGSFTHAGAEAISVVARWDGEHWSSMNFGLDSGTVSALYVHNGDLLAADITNSRIVRWNDASWEPYAPGLYGTSINHGVSAMATFGDRLIAGGNFLFADGIPSKAWAEWGLPDGPTFVQDPQDTVACRGSTLELSTAVARSPIASATWRRNGQPLNLSDPRITVSAPSALTSTLTITSLTAADAGDYDCLVEDVCGTAPSGPAAVEICLADFNCDGQPDSSDFFLYLEAFFSASPDADADGSSTVDSTDFFTFLAAFFEGCP